MYNAHFVQLVTIQAIYSSLHCLHSDCAYSDRAPPQALLYRGKHRTWVCPDSFVPRGELRTRVGEHRTRVPSIRVRTLGRALAASPAIPWSGGTLRRKLPRWWLPSFFVAVDVLAQERAYLAHHDAQARQSKYAAGDQHERETVREQRLGDSEAPRHQPVGPGGSRDRPRGRTLLRGHFCAGDWQD